jgi:hypothetical protein
MAVIMRRGVGKPAVTLALFSRMKLRTETPIGKRAAASHRQG